MTMPDAVQATVTATEVGGVLTVTVGASGDNPTLSTTTSGGSIHVNGVGFTGDFAGVTQIHINFAHDSETAIFDSTDFSFSAPVTIMDTGGTGADSITKNGINAVTINGTSAYQNGTGVNAGTLSIGSGSALGTGVIAIAAGAQLRASGTFAVANQITFGANGTSTLSTTGTLTVSPVFMSGTNTSAVFGSTGNAGTIVVGPGAGSIGASTDLEVAFGTLRNGGGLGTYTSSAVGTSVDSGATLSVNDQSMTVGDLFGTGLVTLGTKTTTLLTLSAGNFGGVISGAGHVQITGGTTLSGTNTYTGGTTINGGTLDIGNGNTTGSVAGNIVDNSALVFVRSNNVTYGGVISGTGTVKQSGTGVLSLTGTNTYSGGTTVFSGVLLASNSGALGTGTVALDPGSELRTSGTVILNNEIDFSSTGSSTLSTTGTLTVGSLGVQGNATFGSPGNAGTVVVTGFKSIANGSALTVANGTLRNGGGLNSYTNTANSTTVNAGATLDLAGQSLAVASLDGNGKVALGTNPATTLSLGNADFGGVISGAGQVAASGSQTVILTGANTYTGGTTITNGSSLQIGIAGTTGSIAGNVVDNGGLVFDRSNALTYAGNISGGGAVVQMGSGGVLTLSGNNSYSHETQVNGGVLAITNGNALGTGTVMLAALTELRGAGTITLPNQVTMLTDSTVVISSNGTLTLQNLLMSANSQIDFGSPGNAGAVTFASNATVTTSTGDFIDVTFGTLRNAGPLNSLTKIALSTTVEAGATLSLNDTNLEVHSLNGMGSVTLGTKPLTTLFIDGGAFQGVISGAGRVDASPGTASFTSLLGANTYTGNTYIDSGTLNIGNGGVTGSVVGNIIDNATLTFFRNNAYTFGGVISGPGLVFIKGGVITLSGNNTFTGGTTVITGVLAITNPNALGTSLATVNLSTGTELRTIGTFALSDNLVFPTSTATISTTGTLTLNFAELQGAVVFGSPGAAGVVVMGGANSLTNTPTFEVAFGTLREGGTGDLALMTSHGGTTTVDAGATLDPNGNSIEIKNLEGTGSVKLGTNPAATLTLDSALFGGVISGAGRVEAARSVISLVGANTYSGGTIIDPGATLQVGFDTPTGSIAGNVVNNGSLAFLRTNALAYAGNISGTGEVDQTGPSVLTLSGTNTYAGGTRIKGGVLAITNGHALGTGTVTLTGLTELRGSGTITLVNEIDLPGSDQATLSSTGTMTISDLVFDINNTAQTLDIGSSGNAGTIAVAEPVVHANATFNGAIVVAFGTLRNAGGLDVFTKDLASTTVNSGAKLDINDQSMTVKDLEGAGSVILGTKASTLLTLNNGPFGGVISGAGGVVVQSPGSVALTGANTYTGGTTISSGTLQIGAFTTTGSITGNIVDNGTLSFARTNAVTFPGIISGTGGVDKEATGMLTLTGNNTYTGGTTLHAGTTLVNNTTGSATGSGTVAVDNGATLGGKGTIAGGITVNSGGILAPGAGTPGVPGTKLHAASVTLNGGGTFEFQLGSTADELIMSGALTKGNAGTYTLDVLKVGTLASSYTLMTFASTNFTVTDFTVELPTGFIGALTETGTSLTFVLVADGEEPAADTSPTRSDLPDAQSSSFSPSADSLSVSPTPEPNSAALLALGGTALLGWRRRRW
jgi:fibronectin-binding autotransporter adhesin